MNESQRPDLTQFDQVFSDPSVPLRLEQTAPTSLAAAARFWHTILAGSHLSARLKELVLVALHASVSAVDSEAIRRHVGRALTAGASTEDVLDVLLSIVGVANHALYSTVPILMSELKAAGRNDAELPGWSAEAEAVKDEFVKTRGFWNEQRDVLARLMPGYFSALSEVSMEPWKNGVLSPKERELIYIAIDCSPTHTYGPGLALHIRHALQHGATRDEILEVFQLAAAMGLEGYVLGAEALFSARRAAKPLNATSPSSHKEP
jgi:alkylhydroperoxidase/carboxymuconolactone decarboxylase family protein YurZ